MKRPVYVALLALLLAAALAVTGTHAPSASAQHDRRHDESFSAFLRKFEEANTAFVNGDASKWMPLVSHSAKTSIFGGFGGYEVGWDQIGPRYEWAAAQFRPSGAQVDFQYLQKHSNGQTAYSVAIERSTVLYVNRPDPVPQNLRVTMVFRKEYGKWKIVHRHADFLAPTGPPPSS